MRNLRSVFPALTGLIAALALASVAAAAAAPKPLFNLREGAADVETATRLKAVNDWWASQNPGQTPCRKCEIRPPGSNLLWVYYRRQGFFPNWVSAARDLLRRQRAGEVETYQAGVREIVSYGKLRTSPDGIRYRINESPYLAPDSTPPPWRDAMGQGLILTLFVPAISEGATPEQLAEAKTLATEYLNSFAVHWRDGGVRADGSAGGQWYLEYATEKGDRARVLNGFMQTLVSMDRFSDQAETLAEDPEWAALRDRAREYVRLGALELNAHLDKYDYGVDQLSRYSLAKPDPAPPVYQTYHRQLLLRLQDVDYLPQEWRDHFSAIRVKWGGKDDTFDYVTWWTILIAAGVLIALLLALRRWQVTRRRSRRVRVVAGAPQTDTEM